MGLLSDRRFGPFFWTQFLGAFNDNMFKNALVVMIAFNASSEAESGMLVNLSSGLFILPFFIISPLAGLLADKYEKSRLIRITKIAEIVIMGCAAAAFYVGNNILLIAILFFMGSQSSFFGPVKYSILPQHLREDEIMEGTGLVEMGTFVAILLGMLAGTFLVNQDKMVMSSALVFTAVIGWLVSRRIPQAPSSNPDLKIVLNPIGLFRDLIRTGRQVHSVWLSIFGISWFWFVGATFLAQIPSFVKFSIHGNEEIVTLFLASFTVSMAFGSWLCNKLADSAIELGLVPLGSIGLSVFAFDLSIVDYSVFTTTEASLSAFFAAGISAPRIVFDLSMIGVFGSFFIVPLYALIQSRSDSEVCSQVFAANNVMNAIFMVGSAIMAMVLFGLGLETIEIFMVVAVMNTVVAFYLFTLLPEFVLRFGAWLLARTVYRMRFDGRANIPRRGAAVVVANHISFIDWFVLSAACQRPIIFVMDHNIFKTPIFGWIFKLAKCIPIASEKEDPECKRHAFELISEALEDGQIVGIFPEGAITFDGEVNLFRRGVEEILKKNPVPVIPVAIHGLWGSFFSRKNGKAMASVPKPKKRKIQIGIGEPLSAKCSAADLQTEVVKMLKKIELSDRK